MNYYEMEIERRLNDKMRCMLDRLDEAFNHLLTDLGEVDKETLSKIRSCLDEFENIKTEVKNTTELSEERVRTLLNSSEEALKAQFATLNRKFSEVLESRFPTGYAEGEVDKIVPQAVATFMEEENGGVAMNEDIEKIINLVKSLYIEEKSPNLADMSKVVTGVYINETDGSYMSNTNHSCLKDIEINGDIITIFSVVKPWLCGFRCAIYDENKICLRSELLDSEEYWQHKITGDTGYYREIDTAGAKYVSVSFNHAGAFSPLTHYFMIAEGQNNVYVPYYEPYKYLKTDTKTNNLIVDKFFKPTRYLVNHNFKDGASDFVNTNWTFSNGVASNTASGWDCQMYRDIRTDFDSRGMSVKFTPNTDNVALVIGNKNKNNLYASTFYGVDFSSAKLQIFANWNNNAETPPATIAEKVCVFPLVVGREYVLEYRRKTLFTGKVIIRDCVTGESDELEHTIYALKGWDNPCIICVNGTASISEFKYFHLMPTETKIAVFGDSFIEGANLNYGGVNSRYVSLIANKIDEEIFIDGRGGESSSGLLEKIKTDYLCKSKYTIIAIGANDYDYSSWLSNVQEIIAFLEKCGSTPIITTISRRTDTDNLSFIQQANEWIRNGGYLFVDVAKAISANNDGETINTELYFNDNVHPNIVGHRAIFNRFMVDVPFLFEESY